MGSPVNLFDFQHGPIGTKGLSVMGHQSVNNPQRCVLVSEKGAWSLMWSISYEKGIPMCGSPLERDSHHRHLPDQIPFRGHTDPQGDVRTHQFTRIEGGLADPQVLSTCFETQSCPDLFRHINQKRGMRLKMLSFLHGSGLKLAYQQPASLTWCLWQAV